jgi:hypothetical protein
LRREEGNGGDPPPWWVLIRRVRAALRRSINTLRVSKIYSLKPFPMLGYSCAFAAFHRSKSGWLGHQRIYTRLRFVVVPQ